MSDTADSAANSNADKFNLETCESCEGIFRLPKHIEPGVRVRCPLCNEVVLTTLDDVPDAIVEPCSETKAEREHLKLDAGARAGKFEDASVAYIDRVVAEAGSPEELAEKIRIPSYERTTARGRWHQQAIGEGAKSEGRSTDRLPGPIRKATAPLKKKKHHRRRSAPIGQESPREFYKFILGGLLAIPAAQLILWWVFASDPLNLAPQVARAVPFVVPGKLRPAVEEPPRVRSDVTSPPIQQQLSDKDSIFSRNRQLDQQRELAPGPLQPENESNSPTESNSSSDADGE